MTKEQEEAFLASFKAGEYSVLSIMIDNKDIQKLMEILKGAGIKIAMMQDVRATMEFADPNSKGTTQ